MGTTITDQFTLITKNMITRKIQSQPGSVHGHLHGDPACLCVVSSSVVGGWRRLQGKRGVKQDQTGLDRSARSTLDSGAIYPEEEYPGEIYLKRQTLGWIGCCTWLYWTVMGCTWLYWMVLG